MDDFAQIQMRMQITVKECPKVEDPDGPLTPEPPIYCVEFTAVEGDKFRRA